MDIFLFNKNFFHEVIGLDLDYQGVYHHFDLYNTLTYVIFFSLKMVKNHLLDL